jgi:hypothetical protein
VSPAPDIRDIRPLILIPVWWHWLAIALAAGAVLAALTVGYRLWRRRSARALTPDEQARRALAKAEALAREGRSREWADVVAGTLRTALSARLGHDACPQTTSELASASWAEHEGAGVDAPRLLELLATCDLTRFAMARLDTESLLASTEVAREWIARLFAPPPSSPPPPQVTS